MRQLMRTFIMRAKYTFQLTLLQGNHLINFIHQTIFDKQTNQLL